MFRVEDFEHVPKAKRELAVKHQVPVWSPFTRTGYHCVWHGSNAMVWFWDEALVIEQQAEAEDHGTPVTYRSLPETVFLPRAQEGVVIQQCGEGYDVQLWRDGLLAESAWYATEPPAPGVSALLGRSASGATEAVRQHASPSAEPWGVQLAPGEWLLANEARLVLGCLLLLSALAVGQEVRYWRIVMLTQSVTADFQALQAEVGPLLTARNQTQELRERNRAMAAIVGSPSQALLMSLLDDALPNETAEFRQWNYQQGELRVVVEDENMNPMAYVRSLEAQPLFTNVRAEQARGRNRIELTMTVEDNS